MSDNSNNVHFSGVRFICSPYLAIKSALASLKMNIIVILKLKENLATRRQHLIFDQALVKMYLLLHLLMDNELVWLR